MRLKLIVERTLAEHRFRFLNLLLLSLFHCQYLNIPGMGSVKGSEAKRQIDSAISSSVSLSNILVLSNSFASGTCGGGGGGAGSGSANDPEPNETFAGAYAINLSGGVGYTFSLTGQISNGSDIDLFSFPSATIRKSVTATFDASSTANCYLYANGDDQSSNSTATHSSDPGDLFPQGAGASIIIGPGSPLHYMYLKCEGTSGQTYSFTITVNQIYSSSGGSGSGSSVTTEDSYLSQAIFDSVISIDTGKSYTKDSVDSCVKSIRTKGTLYAIAKGEAVKQAKICGTSAEVPDRSIFLKDDCTLEETHWIQIDSFGIP